jgi:nitronate monooxygenase
MTHPQIIQGGMGVAISDWKLANAVAKAGQLGVVSGTGVAMIMIARLMDGDPGKHVRRALAHFPIQELAQRVIHKYYVAEGLKERQPYKRLPMWSLKPSLELVQITVMANFVEVWLAKEGHSNPVGINLLEKVQMPNMASLYGAMLAGVNYVIMGAGVPTQVSPILDHLTRHEDVSYRLDVLDASSDDDYSLRFSPTATFPNIHECAGTLKRPFFLPIISSVILAQALIKRAGHIDGFVIETPIAGGHNAPPRGQLQLNEQGEPIYGDRDVVDLSKMRALGYPFWLAGGYGTPDKFQQALDEGAVGIQVGTAFAFCNESGMDGLIKQRVLHGLKDHTLSVRTDPVASPTGFPFKVVQVDGTLSDPKLYNERVRLCDVGYLRHLYKLPDGSLGYRCPAEPVDQYVAKGGKVEDTVGRMCLCNNLGAAAGFPQQRRDGYVEPALVTSGDELIHLDVLLEGDRTHYSAADVIDFLFKHVKQAEILQPKTV